MDIQIDIRERVDQTSFTKRIRYENREGGEKKGGSNRRVVELNGRVEKKDQLAIHHASIPPSSLARIRNQLTFVYFSVAWRERAKRRGKAGQFRSEIK